MFRASDLIGLPVLVGPDLRRIGRVKDVLVTNDGRRICGLAIDANGWFRPGRILDYRAIRAVGPTCLLADREALLDPSEDHHCGKQLLGKPILSSTGDEIGMMDDIHFHPSTGNISALQISQGFVDDLLDGKQVMQEPGALLLGKEAILMAPGDWDDSAGGALRS